MIEIQTTFGTARIVPVNDGWFAVYVPWRVAGGNFNPRLGTHVGQDRSEAAARDCIRLAVEQREQLGPK